jgi:folylpolyglutamate synthase/dihydropteroate synthase
MDATEEAARAATKSGFQARAGVAAALGEIVRHGGRDSGTGRVLICGSLYLAGHVLGENA